MSKKNYLKAINTKKCKISYSDSRHSRVLKSWEKKNSKCIRTKKLSWKCDHWNINRWINFKKKSQKNGNLRTAGPFLGRVGHARFGLHTGTTSVSLCGRNPLRVVGLCRDTSTGRHGRRHRECPPTATPEHVMEHAWADRPKLQLRDRCSACHHWTHHSRQWVRRRRYIYIAFAVCRHRRERIGPSSAPWPVGDPSRRAGCRQTTGILTRPLEWCASRCDRSPTDRDRFFGEPQSGRSTGAITVAVGRGVRRTKRLPTDGASV